MGLRPCRGAFHLREAYGGQVGERRPTYTLCATLCGSPRRFALPPSDQTNARAKRVGRTVPVSRSVFRSFRMQEEGHASACLWRSGLRRSRMGEGGRIDRLDGDPPSLPESAVYRHAIITSGS